MSRSTQGVAQSPKAAHYAANLGAALVRGGWTDANPGAAPNSSPLSWSELIRKWGKHTGGNTELIHVLRNVSLNYLASPRGPARPVGGSAIRSSLDAPASSASGLERARSMRSLSSPERYVNGSSNSQARMSGVAVAVGDGDDASGPGAWAEGAAWGSALDNRAQAELREALAKLQTLLGGSALRPNERLSATLTTGYCLFALGDYEAALQVYNSFDWGGSPTIGVVDGDAAVVERVRARACQGISFERASRSDPARAVDCYCAAVDMLDRLSASPLTTPPYLLPPNAPRPTAPPADSQRELLRHLSTALARAAIISAHGNDTPSTLRILRTYHTLSSTWPTSLRPRQRQGLLSLYLSALYEEYPRAGATVPERFSLTGGAPGRTARATWRVEIVEAMRIGQRLYSSTTAFPRAGEVNVPVIEFADQVSRLPLRAPGIARDAIAVLWWATTLTFQSQSILRQLMRLLAAVGDTIEAKRVFELYVGIVLKARETENPDTVLELKRRPSEAENIGDVAGNPNNEPPTQANGKSDTQLEGVMDSDEEFAEALLVGTRLLLTDLDDPREAWRYAVLAGDVVKQGAVSRKTLAKVEESKGVVRLAMATNLADRHKRPHYQAQAINHIRRATELHPSDPSIYYHLAYAQAASRQVHAAIDSVRSALELDSQDVRSWHLLALLLTAAGDWKAALKAGEVGVDIWDDADATIIAEESDLPSNAIHAPQPPRPLLSVDGLLNPPSVAPPLALTRSHRLEMVIQLRMTLNVIIEKLKGPERALEQQQELFSFFSQRTERSEPAPRPRSGTMSTRALSGRGSVRGSVRGVSTDSSGHTDSQASPPSAPADTLAPPRIETMPPSPAESSNPSDIDEPRRPLGHKKSLLPKHLHVPSVHRHSRSISAPISRGSGSALDVSMHRSRTASASTLALSIAPTAVHSHYQGARSIAAPPPPSVQRASRRTAAEERILSDLWLQSAATFRRAAKLEQSLVAIEEAETHDPENPAVWVQLGLWHIATRGGRSLSAALGSAAGVAGGMDALAAFTKSLLLRPDYPPGAVSVARVHLANGDTDLAHSLLSQLTQDRGWDVPEAWFSLATVCEKQNRNVRARECLLYALELEKTRTCRALADALPRWSE